MTQQPSPTDITDAAPVLVVGAGPTGFTAALELARHGVPVRLIEKADGPSPLSRAVAILPWAMDLLEPSGAAALIREAAQPIQRVEAYLHDTKVLLMPTDIDPDPHVRLFCLPQNVTESLMATRLAEYGVTVEYGHTLESLSEEHGLPQATINGESRSYSYVLGADGSRSTVRKHLGEKFAGYDLPSRWSIADVEASNWTGPQTFQLHFLDSGDVALTIPIGPQRYRVVASQPDALATLPVPMHVDYVHRADEFTIGVRQTASYGRGRVWIAGDAAHIHSPVGGRGMNLGIQDAHEWVNRLIDGTLEPGADDGYSASRHARGRQVIALTEAVRQAVMTPRRARKTLALRLLGTAVKFGPINRRVVRRMLLS